MKIVFIRHMKTPGNEKRQHIGRTDEDLSEEAVEEFRRHQEKSTGVFLSLRRISTSSTIGRWKTAADMWQRA